MFDRYRFSKSLIILTLTAACLLAATSPAPAQQPSAGDRAQYNQLMAASDPAARLQLVDAFLNAYPQSRYRISAMMQGIQASAAIDPASPKVLDYARMYVEAYSAQGQPTSAALAHANGARQLAQAGAHLEVAAEWAAQGLALLPADDSTRGRNTRASVTDAVGAVASARGETERAIELERAAIELAPTNISYLVTLADFLLEAGRTAEAEPVIGRAAIYSPANPVAKDAFDKLTARYREQVLGVAADEILAEASDRGAAELQIATGLAQLEALPDRVITYAGKVGPEAGAEAYLQACTALGQVYVARGDFKEALSALEPVGRIATLYATEYHLARGRALEGLGRDEEAIQAYLAGTALFDREPVLEHLRPLWEKVHGSPEGLDEAKAALAEKLNDWEVEGKFMDYYGREIVQGTPTSIIDGDDYSVGGGPAAAASGRFGLYAWSIEGALRVAPAVTIDLQASRRGRTVSTRATVNPAKGVSLEGRRLRLRLALAEKVVHYTGSNSVAEHRMVVRSLLGGPDGIEVNVKGRTRTDQRLDLAAREQELLAYLTEYEQDPANASRFGDGGGFKAKTTPIADGGLVVVAFVQDEETREVLQTVIVEVR